MSIYDVISWGTGVIYKKNAFVKVGNYYYYALVSHTSGATFAADLASNLWIGPSQDGLDILPFFNWRISYSYTIPTQPKVNIVQYNDGYAQKSVNGINNILLNFDVALENRDLDEYSAIIHFFTQARGATSFLWIPPTPYGILKRFYTPEWTPKQNFYNDYSISAKFIETTV